MSDLRKRIEPYEPSWDWHKPDEPDRYAIIDRLSPCDESSTGVHWPSLKQGVGRDYCLLCHHFLTLY